MDMEEAASEGVWHLYETVQDNALLQQGDLINFKDDVPWRLGLVVTADCDLDKRKHSRLVTLVPLLTVNEVICRCLIFDLFERYEGQFKQAARRCLEIASRPEDSDFLGQIKAQLLENRFSKPVHELLAKVVAQVNFPITVSVIKDLLDEIGVGWASVLTRFTGQIKDRGDLLLLTPPPLIGKGEKIAWLRALWQEEINDIALKTSESNERRGIRVAQLASPFRYRLTQMLGQVFADIGLPNLPIPLIEQELEEKIDEL